MTALYSRPGQSGYAVAQIGAITVQLDGPASRSRKDKGRTPYKASVTWTRDAYGFQYHRSHYRLHKQSVPFDADLIFQNKEVETYRTKYVPGTFKLISVKGERFVIGAMLEVVPNATHIDETSLFAVYQADISENLDLLNQIVNVNWPAI